MFNQSHPLCLAVKLCSLCLSVDQVRETVQILPAFHPSPESLLHGSLCHSFSPNLPLSASLPVPCLCSLARLIAAL